MSDPSQSHVFDMPPQSAGFPARGAWLIRRLMFDLDLDTTQAAGPVGNLGGESGLKAINEIAPMVPGSAGGFGWAQWTGEGEGGRRTNFMNWCREHGLSPTQDEANYGFLLEELRGAYKHTVEQLKKTTTVAAAVFTFEYFYERPADMYGDLPRREKLANEALAAFNASAPAAPVDEPPEHIPPRPAPRPTPRPIDRSPPQVLLPPPSDTPESTVTIMSPSTEVITPLLSRLGALGIGGAASYMPAKALIETIAGIANVPWFTQNIQDDWVIALVVVGGWFSHSAIIAALRGKIIKDFQ